jgi:DnaK suppressor protein
MNASELKSFRKQLTDLQERLGGDVAHLKDEAFNSRGDEAQGSLSHMPIHMADLGTDNYEQENTLRLLANERQILTEIAAAIERLNQGTFGQCEECRQDIPKARLKELPYTRFCVACARQHDQRKT